MTALVLLAKVILDAAATLGFAFGRQFPMALMFAGFLVADAGALWIARS